MSTIGTGLRAAEGAVQAVVERAGDGVVTVHWIKDVPPLLTAASSLFWVIVALAIVYLFRRPLIGILEQMSRGGGTIQAFGGKLEIGAATVQQQALIEDLQQQVKLLSDRIDKAHGPEHHGVHGAGDTLAAVELLKSLPSAEQRAHPHVLWVDDYPENNALVVASLSARDFDFEQVKTTEEALKLLGERRFNAVVSDMGRAGDDDGIVLAKAVRAIDATVPIFIFCSERKARRYAEAAHAAGVNVITSSATVISQALMALQSS